MSKRTTIYLSPPLDRVRGRSTPGDQGFSGRLSTICARYETLLSRSIPELESEQWDLLRDALSGCWMQDGFATSPELLAMEVEDACRLDQAHQHHGIEDYQAFVARLRSLSPAEALAVIETVERWWARDGEASDGPEAEWR